MKFKKSKYCWFVLFSAFIVYNMVGAGLISFGVLYPEYLQYFAADASTTAWIGSVQMGLFGLGGKVRR